MEHYVTLFDIAFAPQGLSLHRSLQRFAGDHTLWVVAMDEDVEVLLAELALPNVQVVSLAEIEGDRLLTAKAGRTLGEYCWTLTPFTFDAVLARDPSANRVTYVDADVWLVGDPESVFASFEESGAAVQITEHAFAPEHDQTAYSGRFCVQFLTMDRHRSVPVRNWWQNRCVEWCFARSENGRFGDQKYLDEWPKRFGGLVHIARPRGRFQGPWNATRFPYSEATTYHFHSLRLAGNSLVQPAAKRYSIPAPHMEYVYKPYFIDLRGSISLITEATGSSPAAQIAPARTPRRIRTPTLITRVSRQFRASASPNPEGLVPLG